MYLEIPLLEYLMGQAKPPSLSDLRSLRQTERRRLVRALAAIPPEAASLREWNDAIAYLAQAAPAETPGAAKERLICLLSPSSAGDGTPFSARGD